MSLVLRCLAAALVLTLAFAPLPPAAAAPGVQGVIQASGTASTFAIHGGGLALEGGGADWTLVCSGCRILVVFESVEPFFMSVEDGATRAHPPGEYEVREFAGLLSVEEEGLGRFFLTIHGYGETIRR